MNVDKAIWEIIGVPVDFRNINNFLKLQEFLYNQFGGIDKIKKYQEYSYQDAFLRYFLHALKFMQKTDINILNKFRKEFVRQTWE